MTAVDPTVDIPQAPEGVDGGLWSARWTGTITPTTDGPHRFTVLAAGVTRLEIDGTQVAAGEREFGQVFDGPPLPVSGTADLRAGHPVSIRLDYDSSTAWPVLEPGVGGGNVRLGWQPPDTRIQEAAELAAGCDVAVVFASHALGEGMDRASLALPGDQDRLIAAVADANPRTVVVLNTGAVSRGGRRRPLRRGCPGRLPLVRRARPAAAVPLRPRAVLRRVRVRPARVALDEATGSVTVSVQVTNVGGRAGAEVVQVYVAAPAAARQLKGFAKVQLEPGATIEAELRVDRDDLAAFDEATGEWVVHPGRYEVLVGRSSRDLRGRPEMV